MNFSGEKETETQFQIAPMIDIVFILLIFFVATYAVAQEEKLLNITLPEAGSATDTARSLREVVVNLGADGRIFVNRRQMTPEGFERRLAQLMEFAESLKQAGEVGAEPGVIIRADAECPHKHVVAVMDTCARIKIRRVFFSTVSPKKMEPQDAP